MASDETSGIRQVLAWLKARLQGAPAQTAASATGQNAPSSVFTSEPSIHNLHNLDRAALLQFAQTAPLVYGRWRDLKWLYKQAEQTGDRELLGILIGRLDAVPMRNDTPPAELFTGTTAYNSIPRIVVVGNHAYVVGGWTWQDEATLSIFDVADPIVPLLLGKLKIQFATRLAVSGDFAYVITHPLSYRTGSEGRLCVVDISAPQKPRLAGWLKLPAPRDIVFANGRAYVACGRQGNNTGAVHVIDVSIPTRPLTSTTAPVPNASVLKVQGSLLAVLARKDYYNANTWEGLQILDLSDPNALRPVGKIDVASGTDLALVGDHAYVTAGVDDYYRGTDLFSGLMVFDLSYPDRIRKVREMPLGEAQAIALSGKFAYIGLRSHGSLTAPDYKRPGLCILDVSDPAQPREIGRQETRSLFALAVYNDTLYRSQGAHLYSEHSLQVADLSNPTAPMLLGDSPSRRTLGYMKRRARRHLNALSQSDPNAFAQIATHALRVSGQGRESVDPIDQWITMDLLFGGSDRWRQVSHGRGAYKLIRPRFVFRRREERYPEVWNTQPDQVRSLFSTPELPWEIYVFAYKALQGNHSPLPEIPEATWARFLRSPSALLQAQATRHFITQFETTDSLEPEIAADAFCLANGRLRRRMRNTLAQRLKSSVPGDQPPNEWQSAFTTRLMVYAGSEAPNRSEARRQSAVLALLLNLFPTLLTRNMDVALAGRLYATGQPELAQAALNFIRNAPPYAAFRWLAAIEPLSSARRDVAIAALLDSLRSKAFDETLLNDLVFADSAWIRAQGWELIAVSQTTPTLIQDLWERLIFFTTPTPVLETAMASPAALQLLQHVPLNAAKLTERLQSQPILVGLLSPEAFEAMARTLPVPALLILISGMSETQWPGLRDALLRALSAAGLHTAFWQAAFQVLGGTEQPALRARLLDDAGMRAAFLKLEDSDVLNTSNPDFGGLLHEWAQAHAAQMLRDSALLLQAAIHPLPPVREWALARAQELGFGLPFALRLLESELPPSVAVGQTFFEAVLPVDPFALEYAVALCDSPKKSTRAYGLDYATRRWESLPHETLLARLAENPASEVQAFVASNAANVPVPFPNVQAFDRDVLRQRNRSRQAKERVKKRVTTQPVEAVPDVTTLLEMARSRTPRDSEWALQQLARLALEGQEIEGITLLT